MIKATIPTLLVVILTSCSLISDSNKLNESDLRYLEDLGLLDKNENVLFYTSSLSKKKSGDFITDRRIASYWIDKDENKTYKNFAYYNDIIKIDSVDLTQAWTYNSYLIITKKDSSIFKVYIGKDNKNFHAFTRLAIKTWTTDKQKYKNAP